MNFFAICMMINGLLFLIIFGYDEWYLELFYLNISAVFELIGVGSDAQDAAVLDGGGVVSQALLASVLAARGEFKEAMRHADEAVQAAPNDPRPYISRSAVITWSSLVSSII